MDRKSRSSVEMKDPSARPEIAAAVTDMGAYDTVIIGFPIWWGVAPRIIDTFLESYDFSGNTMIPFCTSGSSSIGESGKNLAENAGSGNWLDGTRFEGSVTEDELRDWMEK